MMKFVVEKLYAETKLLFFYLIDNRLEISWGGGARKRYNAVTNKTTHKLTTWKIRIPRQDVKDPRANYALYSSSLDIFQLENTENKCWSKCRHLSIAEQIFW